VNSREKILAAIKQNKPADLPLPHMQSFNEGATGLTEKLMQIVARIGGQCTLVDSYDAVTNYMVEEKEKNGFVVNAIPQTATCNINEYVDAEAAALEAVDTFFIKGNLAVAENGAVWLTEKDMGNRSLPFLCRQLVIVVEEENIVADMHLAYKKIDGKDLAYGVFIAGPSKTADIEQSLVVGAHGSLSLQLYIIQDKTK
jgi:L-lactate dehydrogenase complex protein LldG